MLIGSKTGLTEQKMFGGLAFLINGNMAVAASGQGGLLVRVDPARLACPRSGNAGGTRWRCAAARWTGGSGSMRGTSAMTTSSEAGSLSRRRLCALAAGEDAADVLTRGGTIVAAICAAFASWFFSAWFRVNGPNYDGWSRTFAVFAGVVVLALAVALITRPTLSRLRAVVATGAGERSVRPGLGWPGRPDPRRWRRDRSVALAQGPLGKRASLLA